MQKTFDAGVEAVEESDDPRILVLMAFELSMKPLRVKREEIETREYENKSRNNGEEYTDNAKQNKRPADGVDTDSFYRFHILFAFSLLSKT